MRLPCCLRLTGHGERYLNTLVALICGLAGGQRADQSRTVDKARLVRRLGRIDERTQAEVLTALTELFAE
jgi:mRNA-degrading endonuclease toxin of MazEF toxin-antitoxin module